MQFILKQEAQRPDLGTDTDDYWNQRSISLDTKEKKQYFGNNLSGKLFFLKKNKKTT